MVNDSAVYNATEYETFLRDLPGQKYSLDQQCQDLTGESGAISVHPLNQACSAVKCTTPSSSLSGFNTFVNTALDFTTCGPKRVNIRFCLLKVFVLIHTLPYISKFTTR